MVKTKVLYVFFKLFNSISEHLRKNEDSSLPYKLTVFGYEVYVH